MCKFIDITSRFTQQEVTGIERDESLTIGVEKGNYK